MRFLKPAGLVVLAALLGAVVTGTTSPYIPGAAYYGAVGGFLTGLAMLAYRALAKHLGRFTAIAAMSCIGATLFAASALVASTCPGNVDVGQRCSSAEVGTWLLVGLFIPMAWALFLMPPAAITRGARYLWRRRQEQKVTRSAAAVEVRQERQAATEKATVQRRARKAQRQARRTQRS